MKPLGRKSPILISICVVLCIMFAACIAACGTTTDATDTTATSGATATTAATGSTETVTLRFSSWEAETALLSPVFKAWAAELETRTNGKYKVEFIWSGGLGKMGEQYDLVHRGVADLAYMSTDFTPGQFPTADIMGLPWSLPDSQVSVNATWNFYKAGYLDQEFADVHPLMVWSGPGFGLYSTTALNTLADVKGKKVLAGGETETKRTSAIGGVPVNAGPPEWYLMLQKGTADVANASWEAVGATKIYEVTHYCVDLRASNVCMVLLLNQDTYSKMPDDVKKIIDQLSEEILLPQTIERGKSALADNMKLFSDAGGKVITWSDADMTELGTIYAPIWTDWIAAAKDKGVQAQEAVDAYWNILKDLGVETPAIGYAPAQ